MDTEAQTHKLPLVTQQISIRAEVRTQDPDFLISF